MVGDELGHHFDQRRALLGEVRVGPRLARGVGVRVGVGDRIKRLGFELGSRFLNTSHHLALEVSVLFLTDCNTDYY